MRLSSRPELLILRSARTGRKQERKTVVRLRSLSWLQQPRLRLSARGRALGPLPGVNAGGIHGLNTVENTGLEPVTSWLQTRRSPS